MTTDRAQPGSQFTVPVEDPRLAEITRRLVETYRPERIFLFGSRARSDALPDSDYDVLVLVSGMDAADSGVWAVGMASA